MDVDRTQNKRVVATLGPRAVHPRRWDGRTLVVSEAIANGCRCRNRDRSFRLRENRDTRPSPTRAEHGERIAPEGRSDYDYDNRFADNDNEWEPESEHDGGVDAAIAPPHTCPFEKREMMISQSRKGAKKEGEQAEAMGR